MIDYSKFFIVDDDGYPEIRFYKDEDDDEGEFVCFVEAGDTMAKLLSEINDFVNGEPDPDSFQSFDD